MELETLELTKKNRDIKNKTNRGLLQDINRHPSLMLKANRIQDKRDL